MHWFQFWKHAPPREKWNEMSMKHIKYWVWTFNRKIMWITRCRMKNSNFLNTKIIYLYKISVLPKYSGFLNEKLWITRCRKILSIFSKKKNIYLYKIWVWFLQPDKEKVVFLGDLDIWPQSKDTSPIIPITFIYILAFHKASQQ